MAKRVMLWTLVGSCEAYSLVAVPRAAAPMVRSAGASMNFGGMSSNEFRHGTGSTVAGRVGGGGTTIGERNAQLVKRGEWFSAEEEFRHGTGRDYGRDAAPLTIGQRNAQLVTKGPFSSEHDFRHGTGGDGIGFGDMAARGTSSVGALSSPAHEFRHGLGGQGIGFGGQGQMVKYGVPANDFRHGTGRMFEHGRVLAAQPAQPAMAPAPAPAPAPEAVEPAPAAAAA